MTIVSSREIDEFEPIILSATDKVILLSMHKNLIEHQKTEMKLKWLKSQGNPFGWNQKEHRRCLSLKRQLKFYAGNSSVAFQ